jgi:hypothetical protein
VWTGPASPAPAGCFISNEPSSLYVSHRAKLWSHLDFQREGDFSSQLRRLFDGVGPGHDALGSAAAASLAVSDSFGVHYGNTPHRVPGENTLSAMLARALRCACITSFKQLLRAGI